MAFAGAFSRSLRPPFGGEGGAQAVWYDPNGTFAAAGILGDIWAWRAIDTPGSPWGAGPANYAASLIDENQGLVLVEGNGAVPWAGATGWGFVAAAVQWLDTNLIPVNDQSWSLFIQFSAVTDNGELARARTAPGADFGIRPRQTLGIQALYTNGGVLFVAPDIVAGNLGIAGANAYRNGIFDGAIAAGVGNITDTLFVGCRNNGGVPSVHISGNIAALWLCTSNPATVQANALTMATAMSQL